MEITKYLSQNRKECEREDIYFYTPTHTTRRVVGILEYPCPSVRPFVRS
jgi:hypothetical protein